MKKTPMWLAAITACFTSSVEGQSLIPNGDFESGTALCTQGSLPFPWFQAGLTSPGADAYSTDCNLLGGLAPDFLGNFPGLAAFDGLRFVAGWSEAGGEAFGVPLTTPVVAGNAYGLRAAFSASASHSGTSGYEVWLSADMQLDAGDFQVGLIGNGAGPGAWTVDGLVFVVPAGASAFDYMILSPAGPGSDTYMATDAWVMTDGGPATPASCSSSNGTGVNPDIFSCATPPTLGEVWTATVNGVSLGAFASGSRCWTLMGTGTWTSFAAEGIRWAPIDRACSRTTARES